MRELLPESWRTDTSTPNSSSKAASRGPVRDFRLWAECYAVLAGVLVATFPEKAPPLMAYLRTIARASRNYDTDAWVEYDSAFRRRAGNCGSLEWGIIDPALYNETFTGRARNIKRCNYCVVDTHSIDECPYAPKGWADSSPSETRQRGTQRTVRGGPGPRPDAVEICRLYIEKGAGCTYPACRYAHLCIRCHRPHPQFECAGARPKMLRPRSPAQAGDEKRPRS